MDTKAWYYSKTIWVNILFLASLLTMHLFGVEIAANEQMAFIIVVNLVLRIFTGTGLTKTAD